MPIESSITTSILKYLNSLPNCIAEKVKGDSTSSGRADINGCFQGQSFRIEIKTPDNKNVASKKQKINLRKWYNAGSTVFVTYTLQFVQAVIPNIISQKEAFNICQQEQNGCRSFARRKEVK